MRFSTPPALVFGSGLTLLGVIRCLGLAGIPSYVVTQDVGFPRGSRFFKSGPPITGQPLQDYLEGLPFEKAVLFPCSDHWAKEIAGIPERLKERFTAPLPSSDVLDVFLNKGLFAQFLEQHGFPHPKTIPVDDSFEPGSLGDNWNPKDFFLKPRDSQRFTQKYRRKAFGLDSELDLREKMALLADDGMEVLLQEFIPGPPTNHYFLDGYIDRQGVALGLLLRQRLRMHPPRFGNSSYMWSVPLGVAPSAVSVIKRVLKAAHYSGVFSAELKQDPRDNTFKILEVNARPWWYVEFAARCGVNVVDLAFSDLLGHPAESVLTYTSGRHCCFPYSDLSACLRSRPKKVEALLEWGRTLWQSERPIVQWGDPVPALFGLVLLARRTILGRPSR